MFPHAVCGGAEASLEDLLGRRGGPDEGSSGAPLLLGPLGDAKPLGVTTDDVLTRMRREKFLTISHLHDESWFAAAPAGRRFLHRDTAVQDDAWIVRDADSLLDLIYAEHRSRGLAHRPSVQAIGRLDDSKLRELTDALIERGLLIVPEVPVELVTWLELTHAGSDLARERWKESAPPGVYRSAFDGPPPPPMPYRRQLPLRIQREDRIHPDEDGGYCSSYGTPASWLQRSSKTKLFETLKRDGAVKWKCSRCSREWLVYLQGFTDEDQPAYTDPGAATHNRPMWRPTFRYE